MDVSYSARMQFIDKNLRKAIYATIKIYRSAVKFILKVLDKEYLDIKDLNSNEQVNFIEHLIHLTSKNTAKYLNFDKDFYKFPSYLRREVIKTALGIYSSWYSNYQTWLASGSKSKSPKLIYNHNIMPVFYKGNMYLENKDYYIKLFFNKDWVYFKINLLKSDLKYIEKYKSWTKSNPVLERKGKTFSLRYCFSKKIELKNLPLEEQIAIGVDLNVKNTSAVCSAINIDGTVLSRKFINCGSEKDHLNKALQIKKSIQKKQIVPRLYADEPVMYNYNSNKKYYRFIDYANKNYAIKVAKSIIDFAIENNAYTIVFEHLDKKGKKHFLKEKLHYWNCLAVQNITASLAHKNSIHINTVCAWGTSKYAFDGSGEINRHSNNKSICTFTTGKIYNADLNASYNIASRYFIKEIQKSTSEKKWLDKVAKVPSLSKRSTCTLSTLISLRKVLSEPSGLKVPA